MRNFDEWHKVENYAGVRCYLDSTCDVGGSTYPSEPFLLVQEREEKREQRAVPDDADDEAEPGRDVVGRNADGVETPRAAVAVDGRGVAASRVLLVAEEPVQHNWVIWIIQTIFSELAGIFQTCLQRMMQYS